MTNKHTIFHQPKTESDSVQGRTGLPKKRNSRNPKSTKSTHLAPTTKSTSIIAKTN